MARYQFGHTGIEEREANGLNVLPVDPVPQGFRLVAGDAGGWKPFGLTENSTIVWVRQVEQIPAERPDRSAHPEWAAKAAKGTSYAPAQITAAVCKIIETITGDAPDPRRSKTNARIVISLWRSLGKPALGQFVAEACTVARAAHHSPHPLFARDIRAIGWDGGVDRSHSVETVLRQKRWEERLRAATQRHSPRSHGRGDAVDLNNSIP